MNTKNYRFYLFGALCQSIDVECADNVQRFIYFQELECEYKDEQMVVFFGGVVFSPLECVFGEQSVAVLYSSQRIAGQPLQA